MLRIACEGSSKGANVQVNKKFKGTCPLDLKVQEGGVKLKVWQAVDDLEEHVYAEEFQIGDGVVKRIDVELGPSQISVKGQQYLEKYWAASLADVEQRANSGNAESMMEMSKYYTYGYQRILERNNEKMTYWLRKAADAGYPEAMEKLSELYREGINGFSKNEEQSQTWLQRAAEAGDETAIYRMISDLGFN